MFPMITIRARLFLFARCASAAGDWLSTAALSWFLSTVLHGGSQMIATSRLLSAFAVIATATLFGSLLERFSNRRIMIVCCFGAMTVSIAAGVVVWMASTTIGSSPLLERSAAVCAVLVLSVAGGIAQSGRESSEPGVQRLFAPDEHQHHFEHLMTVLHYTARVVFGLVAGLFLYKLERTGAAWLFFLDAASFGILASGAMLSRSSEPPVCQPDETPVTSEKTVSAEGDEKGLFDRYRHGVSLILGQVELKLVFWMLLLVEGVGFTALTLLSDLIRFEVGGGPFGFGCAISISGFGGVCGILSSRWISARWPEVKPWLFLAGSILAPGGILLASFAHSYGALSLGYAVALVGWTWFLPVIRLFCRLSADRVALCAVLTLALFGICRVMQVAIVVGCKSGAGLSALETLRGSGGVALALLVLTFVLAPRSVARAMRLLSTPCDVVRFAPIQQSVATGKVFSTDE